MADPIIYLSEADAAGKEVILVNGACYFLLGDSTEPATFSGDAPDFANCTECCNVEPPEICGPVNANPTVFVTLSWTDEDVTKDFLQCTYTNGQTIENYSTGWGVSLPNLGQRWRRNFLTGARLSLWDNDAYAAPLNNYHWAGMEIDSGIAYLVIYNLVFTPTTNYGTGFGSNNIATHNLPNATALAIDSVIDDNQFGQLTTTSGLTIKWVRGNGW